MNSKLFFILKRVLCALLVLNFAAGIFSETEEERKKKILSTANLAGESMEELMADDNENDGALVQAKEKRLPSTFPRDVPYTKEQTEFMAAYYNHGCSDIAKRVQYHKNALAAAEQTADQYSRYVNLARAEYFQGCAMIETFDLTTLESMDLGDTSSTESINARAGAAFDKAIEYAEKALEIKKGSDAYTILSQAISANCTAKNMSYVLANGLKVRANAKKAVALDYSNGTAHFLTIAQDIYAPWPFSKVRSGRKKMIAILNDKYIRVEDQERLLICSAVGYSYLKQKKWDAAVEWYNKSLQVYPYNYSAHLLIGKAKAKKK